VELKVISVLFNPHQGHSNPNQGYINPGSLNNNNTCLCCIINELILVEKIEYFQNILKASFNFLHKNYWFLKGKKNLEKKFHHFLKII
jgi:hypothetical protein